MTRLEIRCAYEGMRRAIQEHPDCKAILIRADVIRRKRLAKYNNAAKVSPDGAEVFSIEETSVPQKSI